MRRGLAAALVLLAGTFARTSVDAQTAARDAAPIDLTGYWVSYVTENWR